MWSVLENKKERGYKNVLLPPPWYYLHGISERVLHLLDHQLFMIIIFPLFPPNSYYLKIQREHHTLVLASAVRQLLLGRPAGRVQHSSNVSLNPPAVSFFGWSLHYFKFSLSCYLYDSSFLPPFLIYWHNVTRRDGTIKKSVWIWSSQSEF